MLYYLGCHLIDLVLQIQGVPDEIIPFYTGVAEVYKADIEGKGWIDQRKCYNTEPYDRYISILRGFCCNGSGRNGKSPLLRR